MICLNESYLVMIHKVDISAIRRGSQTRSWSLLNTAHLHVSFTDHTWFNSSAH